VQVLKDALPLDGSGNEGDLAPTQRPLLHSKRELTLSPFSRTDPVFSDRGRREGLLLM